MQLARIRDLLHPQGFDFKPEFAKLMHPCAYLYAIQVLAKLQACAWPAFQRQQHAAGLGVSIVAAHVAKDFLQSGAAIRRCCLMRDIPQGFLIAFALQRSDSSA